MPDSEDRELPEPDFDEVLRLANEALEHAHRHRSPPLPHAYEVWYTYVAGKDAALRERIDRELVHAPVVDLEKLEQIYQEHFLQKRLTRDMTVIGDGLDAGLKGAIAVLRDGLGSSQRFLGSLKQAQDRISRLADKNDAKRLATELLEMARSHAAQTESLNTELAKVRVQVGQIHTELRRLRNTAYLDHLTQLSNRRHLDEVLAHEISIAPVSNDPLSFALADLDHFKALNDNHGHAVGDAVLKHFAGLVRQNVKGQDTSARFGGEEFAIIFPRTSLFNAGNVVDKIRRLFNETSCVLSHKLNPIGRMSVSFGVTQLRPEESAATLIERSDSLLYRAKELGRNRVETGF